MKKKRKSKPGACDTPVVTSLRTYGVDFLTCVAKSTTSKRARELVVETLKRLDCANTLGEETLLHGFHGHELLAGRGFAGVRNEHAMINLPGQAIDALRRRAGAEAPDAKILAAFAGKDWRATRVDFAIDTHSNNVSPALVAREFHADRVTCKAGVIKETKETRPDGRFSHTVYIGSAQSTRMLRVYDKKTQMEFVHDHKDDDDKRPWTRFELQSRHEAAAEMLRRLIADGVKAGYAILNGWITFTDPASRCKVACRRPPAPWWTEIVGEGK